MGPAIANAVFVAGPGHSRMSSKPLIKKGNREGSDLWVSFGKNGEEANTVVYKNNKNLRRSATKKLKFFEN